MEKMTNLVVVSKHDRLGVLDLVYDHCASSCNLPNLLKVLKTAQHYMQSNIVYVNHFAFSILLLLFITPKAEYKGQNHIDNKRLTTRPKPH